MSTGVLDKKAVLRELRDLTADRFAHSRTAIGRFVQCQELQIASALLAKAVEQCSRWRAGKRLHPPGESLPPPN